MADDVRPNQPEDAGNQAEAEFAGLMQQFLDSNLQGEEIEKLNDRLRTDPDSRHTFVRYLTQASFLEEQLAQEQAVEGLPPEQRSHTWVLNRLRMIAERKRTGLERKPTWRYRTEPTQPRSRMAAILYFPGFAYVAGGLAAAAVLFALLLFQRAPAPVNRVPASFVARWIEGVDCKWEGAEFEEFDALPIGEVLRLTKGTAELQFGHGARAIVQGPARIEIDDANRMILWRGNAVFHVPETAVGFTVDTPSFRVVDLGTEFGVRNLSTMRGEVYVFQGKVRVEPASTRNPNVELVAGQGAAVVQSALGAVVRETGKVDPTPFIRQLDQN